MTNLKKLGALLLVVVMMLSLSVSAFATGAELANHDGTTTTNEVVRILKEITVYNPANSTVNEPTATYTYKIAAGTAGQSITDATGIQANTKAGVGVASIKMSSQTDSTASTRSSVALTYSPSSGNTLTATAAGTANTKWVDIDFSDVNFGAAGVYRYTITEDLDGSGGSLVYGSNGVIEGNTSHTRYLDVYVKQADGFTDGSTAAQWAVYGYALFTTDNTAIVDTAQTGANEDTLYKTTGFVADSTNSKKADAYYTINVTVSKTVVNDFAMNSHDFEFVFKFENSTVTANVLPIITETVATSGSYTGTFASLTDTSTTSYSASAWASAANLNGVQYAAKFGHGDSVTFTGLPAGTTVTAKEYNDVTGTTYMAKTTTATTNLSEAALAWNTWSGTAAANVGAKTQGQNMSSDNNVTVDFTNTLAQISPTGVTLRIAPYVLMLSAGLVLLFIVRRRNKKAAEA